MKIFCQNPLSHKDEKIPEGSRVTRETNQFILTTLPSNVGKGIIFVTTSKSASNTISISLLIKSKLYGFGCMILSTRFTLFSNLAKNWIYFLQD
jgi:hypothetical protein